MLAETTKEEEEEAVIGKQQGGDIENTANETEARFKEGRDIAHANLWSRYGQHELAAAILEAERKGDVAGNLPAESANLEGYEVHLILLEKRINEATMPMSAWE